MTCKRKLGRKDERATSVWVAPAARLPSGDFTGLRDYSPRSKNFHIRNFALGSEVLLQLFFGGVFGQVFNA